jgi:NAD(P) transhydrogenase
MADAHFDLLVLGSGPAGEKGAAQAAYFGKKVALVEKEPVPGGAAVNTGTLPSKTLRETALYLSGFRQRGLDGVDVALKGELKVADLLHRKDKVVHEERSRIDDNLARHRVTRLQGDAKFLDPHTVQVKNDKITADVILIATGSVPNRPPLFNFEDVKVYDSDEIVTVHMIPKSMAVVGGGVIGCEYACLFAALGTKVTLVESRGALLPFLDAEFQALLEQRMIDLGVAFSKPDTVDTIKGEDDGVTLNLKSGKSIHADIVLVCAGRNANVATLNLEAAGVKTGLRGKIEVNERYQTTAKHIYAAGDVIGFPALASTAMEQARIAVVDAFDLKYKTTLAKILPYGIYTIPECSMAGETEETLKAAKIPYVSGRASFGDNARGRIIGESTGRLKLLFGREDHKLLGVHMIGEGATELVHIGLTALMMGATTDLFIHTCYNYPTLSEVYKYATYDALAAMKIHVED